MKQKHPKRIVVICLPGSGKSTFSTKLGKILSIVVYHLDKHMFEEGRKEKDKEELSRIEQNMVERESWIIEGCALSTLEKRFKNAEMVLYFSLPRFLCLWRIFKRMYFHGKNLQETGCARVANWRLIKYIWNFEKEKGQGIEELRRKYPNVVFHQFYRSKDAENFLLSYKK